MTRHIMFIHGAWLASSCWERFGIYFSRKGYEVSAPEWPRKSRDVAVQRCRPDDLAGLGIREVVDHYAALIRQLDEPPILIGHSHGGLFVQLLLDRGLGSAGVALAPSPPQGVLRVSVSSWRSGSPALAHPSTRRGVVRLSFKQFRYAFANTMSIDEAGEAYNRYVVPDSGMPVWEAALQNIHGQAATTVNFAGLHRAPLLLTAGGRDHAIPASVVVRNHHKYRRAANPPSIFFFPEASHLLIIDECWQSVAAQVHRWLVRQNSSLQPARHTRGLAA